MKSFSNGILLISEKHLPESKAFDPVTITFFTGITFLLLKTQNVSLHLAAPAVPKEKVMPSVIKIAFFYFSKCSRENEFCSPV